MSKRDVLVLGAARSAIGSFGGALSEIEPADLAGTVMKEAVKRSGVDPKAINYVTVGTQGRLDIQNFPSNQLGGHTDMFSQLRSGGTSVATARAP